MGAPTRADLTAELAALRQQVESLEGRQRHLTALLRAHQAVASSLDPTQILDAIVQQAAAISGCSGVRLFLLDETSQVLRCRVAVGLPRQEVEALEVPAAQSFSGQVAATCEPLAVADIRGDPRVWSPELASRYGHVSYLGLPVRLASRTLGVLVFSTPTPRTYSKDEIDFLTAFADQAALALEHARLYEVTQRELSQRTQAEKALRKSDERYRRITRAVTDYIYTVRVEDGRPVETSHGPACVAVTGYTREEFAADPLLWLRMVDEPDQPAVLEQARRVLAGEDPRPLEHRIIRKDGSRRWVRNTPVPYLDAQGRLLAYDGLIQDITERKQAEEALLKRTRQLEAVRTISEEITRELNLTALLGLIHRRAAELVEADCGAIHLWEEDSQALVTRAWHGYGPWRGQVRLRLGEGVVGIVAERREGMIVNDYRTSPFAHPLFLERTETTSVLCEPLLYGERLLGVIILTNDERHHQFTEDDRHLLRLFATHAAIAIENAWLHTAAVQRGAELEALLRATRSVMSGLDLQGILDRIVTEAAQISGCPHVKVLLLDREAGVLRAMAIHGTTAMTPGSTLPLGTGRSGIVAATGRPLYSPDSASDPDNALFADQDRALGILTYLGLPIKRGDEILGVLTFNTTEPREYSPEELDYLTSFADHAAIAIENARLFAELNQSYHSLQQAQDELVRSEKLRALGQMSAGIAHDLNNMLAAILGQVELLRLRATDHEVRSGLATLETAATDGANVVRRLQDFARQRTHSSLRPLDLRPVVAEALAITRPRWEDEAHRRGVVIAVETCLEDCPPVLGHAPEIREVLTNLILNAVDAMPHGGTLRIAAQGVNRSTGQPVDSSRPIDNLTSRPVDSPKEWVELSVTDTGIGMTEAVRQRVFEPFFTTKGRQGSGLGLSVAYGIMVRHGGRIQVASAPGQGTTMTLRFAVAPHDAVPAMTSKGAPAPPRRILLIDDDVMVRQTLATLLRTAGHFVQEAGGGAAGLDLLHRATVDLVLTDLGMPEVTGWDVARAVKARTPRLPVVLLTGWGEQAATEASAEGLVECVLGKPVRLEDLLRVVADLTTTR